MADLKEVLVPDVGGDEVEVIELCVEPGTVVEAEDSLVTVESDKASMDIPAPFAGKVVDIKVAVGSKVSEGTLLVTMQTGEDSEPAPVAETELATPAPAETASAPEAAESPAPASTPSSSATGTVEAKEVRVPDIGDSNEVDVIEVLVAVGDVVEAETGLITLETDKATMDVPAPFAGTIKELKIAAGDKASEGTLIAIIETAGNATASVAANADAAAQAQPASSEAPSVAAASASNAPQDVYVPDIGDSGEVDVIEVLVAVGDEVEAEAGLITLETDKATMDVPAPFAGTIKELKIAAGDKASQGTLIAIIQPKTSAAKASAVESKPTAAAVVAPTAAPQAASRPPPVPHHPSAGEKIPNGAVFASPSIRRIAREFGVDLTKVTGSGRKGRILKEDVQSYVKYELSRPKATAAAATGGSGGLQILAAPKVDFTKFGEVEEVPLTRIQKISGPNLHRNWVTIPHVTQFDEADITEVEAFRKEQNVVAEKQKLGFKITPLVFIMKAAAKALLTYPVFNSSLSEDGEHLVMKKYVHIGIAVETPGGLVVPVIRDVDKKGIYELSKELLEVSKKARDGKLKANDMQGSCFTISSLGGIGGTAFTPIVNAPDVAILGVSKSEMKPKWNGADFEPRLMLPLSLSYDHRVIDGALAARFAVEVSGVLSDIRRLTL